MRGLAGILIIIAVLFVIFGFIYGRDYYDFSFQLALSWFVYAIASAVCAIFFFWLADVGDNLASLEHTNKKILEYLEQRQSTEIASGTTSHSFSISSAPSVNAQYLRQKESLAAKPGDNPAVARTPGESDAHYWERVSRS